MTPPAVDTSGNALHRAIQSHADNPNEMLLCELITEIMKLRRVNLQETNRQGQTPFVLACTLGCLSAALQLTHYHTPGPKERTKAILSIPSSVSVEDKTDFLKSLANNLQLALTDLTAPPTVKKQKAPPPYSANRNRQDAPPPYDSHEPLPPYEPPAPSA